MTIKQLKLWSYNFFRPIEIEIGCSGEQQQDQTIEQGEVVVLQLLSYYRGLGKAAQDETCSSYTVQRTVQDQSTRLSKAAQSKLQVKKLFRGSASYQG